MLKTIMKACLGLGTQFYMLSRIVEITGFDRKDVRHRLWKLEAAGMITRISCKKIPLPDFSKGRPNKEICYRNTKLLSQKVNAAAVYKDNGWDRMWKTIRALRHFTRDDLAKICEQNIENVRFFTKHYRKLGFIRPSGNKNGREIIWSLVKDPGARRPIEVKHVD